MRKFPLLAAPLVLAACGSSSDGHADAKSAASLRRAEIKTAALASEHMTVSLKMNIAGAPAPVWVDLSGDFTSAPDKGNVKVSQMSPAGPDSVDEVVDGDDIYLSSPSFAKTLSTVGKKWIKVDLAGLGKATEDGFAAVVPWTPTDALRQIEGAGTVTEAGPAIIGDVMTTHYRIEDLDVAKLPGSPKVLKRWQVTYGPMDVWVGDADGYIYRETLSADLSLEGQSADMTVSSDFSKFGEPVSVTIPPASQTLDGAMVGLRGHSA